MTLVVIVVVVMYLKEPKKRRQTDVFLLSFPLHLKQKLLSTTLPSVTYYNTEDGFCVRLPGKTKGDVAASVGAVNFLQYEVTLYD